MNFLILGDVFGDVGKEVISNYLDIVRNDYAIDFLIINAENISKGKGMTYKDYNFLYKKNVDVITMGNHIWFRDDIKKYILNCPEVLKPLNLPRYTPGNGTVMIKKNNLKIRVTSIIGRVFMFDLANNPFEVMDDLLINDESDIHIVDFHGEATSEKLAFAKNYDGKLTALFGTHTHVQTADGRILPNGTAFLTDVGMNGPYDGIIGVDPSPVITKLKTGMPNRFFQSESEGQFNAWIIKIDEKRKKVVSHETISINPQQRYEKPE